MFVSGAGAQDRQMQIPGPPLEMQQCSGMVGTWLYTGEMRMQPTDTAWIEHQATAEFSYVAGGAALQMRYTGDMMGMEMHGLGMLTYDREDRQWQETWVDNFGGRTSLYTGTFADGTRVMQGVNKMQGQTMHTRITTYDIAETTFKWTMENSMDGKNWFVSMKGSYQKQPPR